MTIREKVYGFKTKNDRGFVKSEIDLLLRDFPKLNLEMFNDALIGITCTMSGGEIVIYPCDIEKAIYCGLENRKLTEDEFD